MNDSIMMDGIEILVTKKTNLKNLYVRIIPPNGEVRVTSPTNISLNDINLFLIKKMPEIIKVREKMLQQERQSIRQYVSGETHYLWGKPFRLQVIQNGNKYSIKKRLNKLIFSVPISSTTKSREKAFDNWYRSELKRVLDIVSNRLQIRTNIFASEFRIKNMKTRWGTCNINDRRIWINLQLVKKPVECLEYVVTHELVHLIEENHTNRFNSLVDYFYPGWKETREHLKNLPLDYLDNGDTINESI